jgi:hypothetical protein
LEDRSPLYRETHPKLYWGIQYDRRRDRKEWQDVAYKKIIHAMAGPVAEVICDNKKADQRLLAIPVWMLTDHKAATRAFSVVYREVFSEGSDWWHVQQYIPMLGRRWRLHMKRAFKRTMKLVSDHPLHIGFLAGALVKRGRIEGDDVRATFMAAGRLEALVDKVEAAKTPEEEAAAVKEMRQAKAELRRLKATLPSI